MMSTVLIIAFIYLVFGYGITLELLHDVKDMAQMHGKKTADRRHVQIA